ncbi:MAG: hotdog domain-containing protein [Desulfobacterales bacterium]|jgi:TetR/AcrR family transcriptional repressor of nem operon
MKKRSALKEASLKRIIKSGAARLREEGLSGSVISTVMQDAGLTHGTFYSHFRNKNDLLIASLQRALVENRPRWISDKEKELWPQRLIRLAKRYLTAAHRDDLSNSCALAALVSEAARSNADFRRAYEVELYKSIDAICGEEPCDVGANPERFEEAVMFMALCIGGINISRAVDSKDLSDHILNICRKATERIANRKNLPSKSNAAASDLKEDNLEAVFEIEQFPIKTYEKLRYADTDRQGHVNNAVFSTMLETGRVEILYDSNSPLAGSDCSFVIASQKLNFHAEINWPGRVDIGTKVSKIGRSSIIFEQALFQHGQMKATAKTVIVQMNENTRHSEPLSNDAVEHLNRLVSTQ